MSEADPEEEASDGRRAHDKKRRAGDDPHRRPDPSLGSHRMNLTRRGCAVDPAVGDSDVADQADHPLETPQHVDR